MKIALISPSNLNFTPYVNNYIKILEENNVKYDFIYWDRFNESILDKKTYAYKDKKTGHRRNFFDYFKYTKFVKNTIRKKKYDKIIVFGIQLSFFLQYQIKAIGIDNYIIDIRDYHSLIKFIDIRQMVKYSYSTVISSDYYKKWLPKSNKIIVNHNTRIQSIIEEPSKFIYNQNKNKIKLAFIGAPRDLEINLELIDALKDSKLIDIYYHGEGHANEKLISFCETNNIKNVFFTGRYCEKEKKELYDSSDIINVLKYSKDINNQTAIPNRLYDSLLNLKPLLTFVGSDLTDIINKNNFGLVISDFSNLEKTIIEYLEKFDHETFLKKRNIFLSNVIKENKHFTKCIIDFVNNSSN